MRAPLGIGFVPLGSFALLSLLVAACGAPPSRSPAAAPAHAGRAPEQVAVPPSPELAPSELAPGQRFTFEMWTPAREDFAPRARVRAEWVACSVRTPVSGATAVRCTSAPPRPDKLEASLARDLARCYSVEHRAASEKTVEAIRRSYAPDAKEETRKGAMTFVTTTTDTSTEVPIHREEPPPYCVRDRPGHDCGMIPRYNKTVVGTRVETKRSVEGPWPAESSLVPVKVPAYSFSLAIPVAKVAQRTIRDARFDVTTSGSQEAFAAELARRLEGIDLGRESAVVVQAVWLNRALLAMIRRDRAALDVAYEGLEKASRSTPEWSWARAYVHTLGQIRVRGLVFDDPCSRSADLDLGSHAEK